MAAQCMTIPMISYVMATKKGGKKGKGGKGC